MLHVYVCFEEVENHENTPQPLHNTVVGVHSINRVS